MKPALIPPSQLTKASPEKNEEKGVVGIALVVWLLGGGLGLVLLVFLLSAIF